MEGHIVFLKIVREVPVPTWLGFIISMFSVLASFILPWSVNVIFFCIVAAVSIAFLLQREYRLSLSNHAMIVLLALLGHIPYLLVAFMF